MIVRLVLIPLNLDAFGYLENLALYPEEVRKFLDRGGVVAWGIVPTSEDAFGETRDSLLARLYGLWNQLAGLGVDRLQLRQQSMITPACGTGLLSEELAQRIYALTAEVSAAVGA